MREKNPVVTFCHSRSCLCRMKKGEKIMVKKFGKGGIIALSLHPLSRERARGKEVKRGDGKKV